MADHFYGVNLQTSKELGQVTVGTVTGGNTVAPIELRINDGNGFSKTDVITAIAILKAYITTADAPA